MAASPAKPAVTYVVAHAQQMTVTQASSKNSAWKASWRSQNGFCRARPTCGSRHHSTSASGSNNCSVRTESPLTEIGLLEPAQLHPAFRYLREVRTENEGWGSQTSVSSNLVEQLAASSQSRKGKPGIGPIASRRSGEDKPDSRNRYSVEIPLSVAAIERVDIGGRAERDELALDSPPAGQATDFFAGAKSARRNTRQNLASR